MKKKKRNRKGKVRFLGRRKSNCEKNRREGRGKGNKGKEREG